jgi:hypothetical protein
MTWAVASSNRTKQCAICCKNALVTIRIRPPDPDPGTWQMKQVLPAPEQQTNLFWDN